MFDKTKFKVIKILSVAFAKTYRYTSKTIITNSINLVHFCSFSRVLQLKCNFKNFSEMGIICISPFKKK